MDSEAWWRLEQRLVALARSAGPLRTALAALWAWLVEREAWKQLGYARLSDYADEALGRSVRSVRDLARVGRELRFELPLEVYASGDRLLATL